MTSYLVYEHEPVDFSLILDEVDIAAIKAVQKGEATPDQQQRFFETLCTQISPVGGPSIGQSSQATDFNEGIRMVGICLLKIVATTYDQMEERP